jgi:RNA polymerase-interacting CarD/CdnL/TRCF family regulator
MFKIGQKVVHPLHGVGEIIGLGKREFEPGVNRQYYEIGMPEGSTVWVPAEPETSGLRKPAAQSDLEQCREILRSEAAPLPEDRRNLLPMLVAQLRQGTIVAHCHVVRDLHSHFAHRPMIGSIADFLQGAQQVLSQEWALVEGRTQPEAAAEIRGLLENEDPKRS